ncbi:hypothetical protein TCAL_11460 [Tigriopus californicus]|uniref:CCHC-type domain-containing protein n=1 Tax=Tigriopus californicus TaxID=6832 RepID=A0A553PJN7_TIGCA|nr:hypothetical protein TCAL_11460 [Tigriopus californicus]
MQLVGQEAELDTLNPDDLYVLRLVTGTTDRKLKEEFLRESDPTRSKLVSIAKSWETASQVEDSMNVSGDSPNQTLVAAVSNGLSGNKKKGHKPGKFHIHHPQDILSGSCMRCGKAKASHEPHQCLAKGQKCSKCGTVGHLGFICMKSRQKRKPEVLARSASEPETITSSSVLVRSTAIGSNQTPRALVEVHPTEDSNQTG